MLNVAMPEPRLQCPGIVTRIRQRKAAGVPQHVRVDRERHAGPLTEARDERMEALWRHRAAALRGEHVRPGGGLLALQAAQGPDLIALHRVHARRSPLAPAHMQATGPELDLV